MDVLTPRPELEPPPTEPQRRDERMAKNEEEKDAHVSLLAVMKEEGLESYEYGDIEVHIDSSEKCKVKIGSKSEPSKNGDGEGD